MRYLGQGFTVFILVLTASLTGRAQTSDAATNYYQKGAKQFERGNLDAAIEDYTRAIEISSRLDPSRRDRAPGYDGQNFFNPSDHRIVAIDPLTARAYTNRGISRYRKGDLEGGLKDLELAISLNLVWLPPGLVVVLSAVQTETLGEPLEDFDRAILIDPKVAEAYNNRADLRLDEGDIDGALVDLNRSLRLKPRLAETFYQLGYVQLAKKDWEGAIADFERALQLKPEMAVAYQGLGTAWLDKGDTEHAIRHFDRALQLDPNLSFAYMNRGLALLLQGRDSEAQKDFDQCLAKRPSVRIELARRVTLAKELRSTKPGSSQPH